MKQFRQLRGSFLRDGIPPCAERHHQFILIIKSHVTVHHCAKSYGANLRQLLAIPALHILRQFLVAILQPCPDIVQTVCPDTALQPVLPIMGAGRNGLIVFIHQNRLNPGRAKLNAQYRLTARNTFLCSHLLPPVCRLIPS